MIFKPLLAEMESMNESLDKEEFVESALRLYNVSYYNIFILIDINYY
jgi:hypothetical protein